MKLRILFIFLMSFCSVKGQDSVVFENCLVVAVDSIDYCTSHYSFYFIAYNDTFKSVIEKQELQNCQVAIGDTINVKAITLDSIVFRMLDRKFLFVYNLRPYVSHVNWESFDQINWTLDVGNSKKTRTQKRLKKSNKEVKFKFSLYYIHGVGYPLLPIQLNKRKAHGKN